MGVIEAKEKFRIFKDKNGTNCSDIETFRDQCRD